MNCIDLTSKRSKKLSYVAKHSKQRKTTKVIKLQWIASIWCQKHRTNAKLQNWSYFEEFASIWRRNDQKRWGTSLNIQNYAKLQKKSNYNELHRFDIKTIKNVELRRKTFETTQIYKSDHITMNCIDLMSKLSKNAKLQKQSNNDQSVSIWRENDQKCWVTSQNIQNNAKLRKWSNYNELHRFDVKTITTTQNYESDQIIMHCINLTSKRSKKLSYVAKLQMWSYYDEFASIWRQNDNNNSKLRKWSNYNALHQFDVKTI